jgi:Putative DNA-binding domain
MMTAPSARRQTPAPQDPGQPGNSPPARSNPRTRDTLRRSLRDRLPASALANTFGGVVLVGVDEDKQGPDRLTGIPSTDRTRLVSWCWSRLTPPFSPEVIPVSLGHDDLYVLAVVINTDYIRRPVMISQGNRVPVRLDDQNQAPDWYRLRDLFTEQAPGNLDLNLPPADPTVTTRQGHYPDTDLALRGRLLLAGPRGV